MLFVFNSLKDVIESPKQNDNNPNKVSDVFIGKRELMHKVEMKNDQLKLEREMKGSMCHVISKFIFCVFEIILNLVFS